MAGVSTDLFAGSIATLVPIVPQSNTANAASDAKRAQWSYEEAFKRNRGLITEEEQEKLRNSRVAIAGMGGVGGVHLITLARLGIGKFTIADPDVFEVANFNRQYGATISNLGRNKAEVMAEAALDVNPELQLRVMPHAIDASNVDKLLRDADLLIDGLDFFAIDARRTIFRRAAERGIWAVTAGPIGFSTAWLAFDPAGMTFDRYFDLSDSMDRIDQLAAFAVGLTPKATHICYTDLSIASLAEQTGPSASIGCQLAAGVMGTVALKVLLNGRRQLSAPRYLQFDAYQNRLAKGRLWLGNRSSWQRLKRGVLRRRFAPQPTDRKVERSDERAKAKTAQLFKAVPPIHRYVPLILGQIFSRQTLERVSEPVAVTDQPENVLQYDQVMTTKLAIAYAIGLEIIYRARQEPFTGSAIDLACGPGHFSLCMAKYLRLDSLVGIDLSQRMIDRATANAEKYGQKQATFRFGDVTQLKQVKDRQFELCAFTDAAHHMPDLETLALVFAEMDRVTKHDGLIFVMDLVRLKTKRLTDKYVDLVGRDYCERGLSAFHNDFQNSMYAAWKETEICSVVPETSNREWVYLRPMGLPTMQILLGLPLNQRSVYLRRGQPWFASNHPVMPSMRIEWQLARQSLKFKKRRTFVHS